MFFPRLQALNVVVTNILAKLSHDEQKKLSPHHQHHGHADSETTKQDEDINATEPVASLPCCSTDPAADLERMQQMAQEMDTFQQKEHHEWDANAAHDKEHINASCCDYGTCSRPDTDEELDNEDLGENQIPGVEASVGSRIDIARTDAEKDQHETDEHNRELLKTGINTAIAIGTSGRRTLSTRTRRLLYSQICPLSHAALHNFPEGLATFVASLSDPKVGGVLAVAIAIHNIPMGLCVALPIYYATGHKWKAFTWACLAASTEPIAALLGWAVLANRASDTMFGVLFGLTAGMLAIISARELLPTAHRYDPEDSVVTFSFMGGMFVMALSLNLFNL